jgi:D-amino peptidase
MMAGMLGVPTVFISGDDKAVAEARELIPRIHAATVKQSLGLKLALHLSARASRQLIRKVAGEAVRNMESITPLVTEPPFVQEIRVKEGVGIENYLEAGAEKIDDRTVLFRSHDLSRLHV